MPPIYQRQPILPVTGYAATPEPEPLGPSPLPSAPETKVAKDAKALWDKAAALTERLAGSVKDATDAGARLVAARDALADEVARGAVTGKRDSAREAELVAEVQSAELEADPGILQRRFRVLLSAQCDAVRNAHMLIRVNLAELIESEYRPIAESAWAELAQAEAGDSRSALESARAAYEDVRAKVSALSRWAFAPHAFVVPSSGLPLPPCESYMRPEAITPVEPTTFDPNTVKAAQVARHPVAASA